MLSVKGQSVIPKQISVSCVKMNEYEFSWVVKNVANLVAVRNVNMSSLPFVFGKENQYKATLRLTTEFTGWKKYLTVYGTFSMTDTSVIPQHSEYFELSINGVNQIITNAKNGIKFDNREQCLSCSGSVDLKRDLNISLKIKLYQATINHSIPPTIVPVVDHQPFTGFEQLLEKEHFSDVTLIVGDKHFKVYKGLLAASSRVFAAMFEHKMIEFSDNTVKIDDVSPEVMKEVLRFIYAGKVNDLDKMAIDILAAADKYELLVLKSMCEASLMKNLSVKNFVDILIVADRHKSDNLKSAALDFLTLHSQEIINTEKFKAVMKTCFLGEILSAIKN